MMEGFKPLKYMLEFLSLLSEKLKQLKEQQSVEIMCTEGSWIARDVAYH